MLLLPTAEPLPSLRAAHAPLPCVALCWQLLAVRLMLGFAKTKFGQADVAKEPTMGSRGEWEEEAFLAPFRGCSLIFINFTLFY